MVEEHREARKLQNTLLIGTLKLLGGGGMLPAKSKLQDSPQKSSTEREETGRVSKKTQIFGTLFATIGSFGLGTNLSWTAPVFPQISKTTNMTSELFLTTDEQSWVASILNFGAFAAGPIAALLIPRYGKKWSMMILSVPIFGGWLCLLFARNVAMLYVGRFLTGFSGAFSVLAPGFITELCQIEIRGALATSMQLMTMLGLLSTYSIGAYIDWRTLTIICSTVPVFSILSLTSIPRSPVFLLTKGLKEDARLSLQFYRGSKADVDEELIKLEQSITEMKSVEQTGMKKILTDRTYLKPLILSLMLMMLQQLSGIKFIQSYIFQIFLNAGSHIDSNMSVIIVGVVQVTGTSVSALLVEKFGRRKLLILSEILISIAFWMLGSYCFLQEHFKSYILHLTWLPLMSIITFSLAYSLGMGPLPWVLNAELFSKEAKASSSTFCASFNWLFSFLVVKCCPILEASIGASGSYLTFATIALFGAVLIGFTLPETKGKSEEEIKNYFKTKNVGINNNDISVIV